MTDREITEAREHDEAICAMRAADDRYEDTEEEQEECRQS